MKKNKKSLTRTMLSAAILTQTLFAGVASAERLPDDPYAKPKPGEEAPSSLPPLESSLPTSGPLEYKVDHNRSYGNVVWGGSYRFYENVRAPSLSFQSVNMDVNVRGRLFSKDFTAIGVNTGTWNPSDNSRSSRLNVMLGNQEVFAKNESSTEPFSTTTASFGMSEIDKQIFAASKTYGLGPIGVTVDGKVKVRAAADLKAQAYRTDATKSGAALNGYAYVNAYGSMSAGADAWIAAAGVRGNVTFADLLAVKNLESKREGNYVHYDTELKGKLCTLDGSLELWGRLGPWSGEMTILDWEGKCINGNWGDGAGSTYMGSKYVPPVVITPPILKAEILSL